MGCFPERTLPKYDPLPPENQRLVKNYHERNPNNDSIYVPINLNDTYNHSKHKQRARRGLSKNSPTKDRRNNNKFKRQPQSEEKIGDHNRQKKLERKKTQHEYANRKKGKIIQLPFRPHIITKIQTPSASVKSSTLSQFQNHPSLFFVRPDDQMLKMAQSNRITNNSQLLIDKTEDQSPRAKSIRGRSQIFR